jgi:archaellum component FlaC
MARRDREESGGEGREDRARSGSRKSEAQQQTDLVNNMMEEVRTLDSEVDLLKQKVNLIIREINVLKHVVLAEKGELKELQAEEEQQKSRFESILNIVKGMRDNKQ